MTVSLATHALLGLLPVCCFLAALVLLDSYKLVALRWVVGTILIAGMTAGLSYFIHTTVLDVSQMSFVNYSRYVSPFIEEALKGILIVILLYRNRIGFLVDAAIFGFAVGAGFAVIENIYMLQLLPQADIRVWIIRGFGTAIMHGGATAVFAIIAHTLSSRQRSLGWLALVPGYLIATATHSIFNHFFFTPLINTLIVLICLPALLVTVFDRSERSVSQWLGMGFDADTELLQLINSGELSTSKVGLYLESLKQKFAGPVVADLLCYLRLHTELSIRAKGLLMMRESGFMNKTGEETKAKLIELKYLETSIGTTGLLAIRPFLKMRQKDLWQFYMLGN